MILRRSILSPLVLLVLLNACTDHDATSVGAGIDGTFAQLQASVLTPQCVSCHQTGTDAARQSGLILTPDVSWLNLVNVAPTNANARADQLLRVMPRNPSQSLLFHKLQWGAAHHSRDYGSPMPLGTQSLYLGQIEFVQQWITAGAPRQGFVADSVLLADRTMPGETFQPLAPPAKGYQLSIERFTVRPNFERELFVYKAVGNTAPIFVNRIETRMRTNSHHLLIQTFQSSAPPSVIPALDAVRDIRSSDGSLILSNLLPMPYHVFFAGSMTPSHDYSFPPGVALRVPANARLDLNSHYVNRSNVEIAGEVSINLHTVDSAQVTYQARTLELHNTNFTLPPNTRTTITRVFPASQVMRIFMLTSHMHEHGEKFMIRIQGGPRDGEVVYTSTDWAHPDILTFATPIMLQPGQALVSEVTYNNTTGVPISFGLTSRDEMDIIFGYYY